MVCDARRAVDGLHTQRPLHHARAQPAKRPTRVVGVLLIVLEAQYSGGVEEGAFEGLYSPAAPTASNENRHTVAKKRKNRPIFDPRNNRFSPPRGGLGGKRVLPHEFCTL